MNKLELTRLNEAIALLKSIETSPDELRIEAESSFTEAVILGTRFAYLRTAVAFLELARSGEKSINTDTKYFFNDNGAVWPVSSYVLEDESAVSKLASELSNN